MPGAAHGGPVGTNAAMRDDGFNVEVREFGGVDAGQAFQGASVLRAGVGWGHAA